MYKKGEFYETNTGKILEYIGFSNNSYVFQWRVGEIFRFNKFGEPISLLGSILRITGVAR